jgi:hypothetical protein
MVNVKGRVRVHTGEARSRSRRPPPIESGYQHFRLERQGAVVAANTLFYYDRMVLPFLDGLAGRDVRAGGNGPGRSARPDDRLSQSCRVELRMRWDAGPKGRGERRVPIAGLLPHANARHPAAGRSQVQRRNGTDVNASPEVFHSRRQQRRRFPVKAVIDAEPPITPGCPVSHDDSVANLHHRAEGGTTTATLTP